MSFRVMVLGGHAQLLALEARVGAAKNLKVPQRSALHSDLVRADRYVAAGAGSSAKSQLRSFITTVVGLPTGLTSTPTEWIQDAERVIALLG